MLDADVDLSPLEGRVAVGVFFCFMPLTLANWITLGRILSVPALVLLLIYYQTSVKQAYPMAALRLTAVGIFCATLITDAIDGWLARHRREITRLGAVLDPLADKALFLSALILLSRPSSVGFSMVIPAWFAVLCISRDAMLVLGTLVVYFVCGDVAIRARLLGKITTVLQAFSILSVLIDLKPRFVVPLLIVTAAAATLSAAQYAWDGIKQLDLHQKKVGA